MMGGRAPEGQELRDHTSVEVNFLPSRRRRDLGTVFSLSRPTASYDEGKIDEKHEEKP